jgi:hypothetical protein
MPLAKLDEHPPEIPQPVPLVRRLARALRLAYEAQLEPKPVLGGLRDARYVPPVDLDATDELVESVLVRVRGVGQVTDSLVVFGEEAVPEKFRESARGTNE